MRPAVTLLLLVGLNAGTLAAAAPVANTVVIRNVSLFDTQARAMVPACTVVIVDERIAEVRTGDAPAAITADALLIDGTGKFLIPGLIDAHVHLVHLADRTYVTGDQLLPLFLAAGVTSVRSTGDAIVAEAGVAHFAEKNPDSCPRVFLASPLIDGDPPFHRDVGHALVDVAQVPAFIDDMARWNVTTLKIYVGTPREIGRAVIQHGHQRGMIVTGHLGAYSAQDAVEDGIDCLEHIWSVFNYSIPAEATSQPDYRSNLDLQNPKCQELVLAIAQRKVAVDPTLVVFRNMIYLNDLPAVREHADVQLVPASMRAYWNSYAQANPLSAATLDARQREVRKYQELTGILHRAGVPILAGTDAPEPFVTPGFALHQELEMLVESGLSPADAICAATVNNARMVGQESALGQIAPGMQADLVLLTADPTADIRNTRKVDLVLRSGRVVVPAELMRAEAERMKNAK